MLKKKSSAPNIDGKHNMTGLELCEADDLATMMTVDAVLGITTHKMDKNFNPHSIDKKLKERWKGIMEEFIAESNYENAYQQLIANDKVKAHWKKDERFKRHMFRFLYLFDKRSGIEIKPCFRYENEGKVGAGIYATKEWDKGCQVNTLFGCIAEIRQKDEEYFREHKNEFSVMYSTRKNCSQLWLGPAAYVNHDCMPNCRFTEGNDDTKMLLETLRPIQPGDEFVIFYGQSFFGIDNAECECFTCELQGRGYFSPNFDMNISSDINNNIPNYDNLEVNCELAGKMIELGNQIHSPRRIITRSTGKVLDTKMKDSSLKDKNQTDNSVKKSNQKPLQTISHWEKSNKTKYSLRVTYNRMDRVKKSILTLNESEKTTINQTSNISVFNNVHRNNTVINALKRKATLKTSISNRIIGTRSSSIKNAKCPKLHFSVKSKTNISYNSEKDNLNSMVTESKNDNTNDKDRNKKDSKNNKIEPNNISTNNASNPRRKSMRQKEKPKRFQNEVSYPSNNSNFNNDSMDLSPSKLKLILRKNDKNGGKYGILNIDNEFNSESMKSSTDRNIFNCINTEYFLEESPPKLKLSLSPKPPNLSPWFYTINATNSNPSNGLNSNNKLTICDDTHAKKHKRLRRSSSTNSSLKPSNKFKKHNLTKVFRKPPILQENHIEDDESIGDDPPQILKIINLTTQPIIVDSSSNSSSTSSCLLASYKSEESIGRAKSINNFKKKKSKLQSGINTIISKYKSVDNIEINVQKPPILLQEESSSSIETSSLIMPFDDNKTVTNCYNNSNGCTRITPPPKLFSQVDYNYDSNNVLYDDRDDLNRNIISPNKDTSNTNNKGIRLKISRLKGSNKFTTLMTPPR